MVIFEKIKLFDIYEIHTFIDNIPTDFAKKPNEVDTRNLKVLVQQRNEFFYLCD